MDDRKATDLVGACVKSGEGVISLMEAIATALDEAREEGRREMQRERDEWKARFEENEREMALFQRGISGY
jgi:hypothetical protein